MRISQRNILLTHNRTMTTTLQNLTDSNNKMSSGRSIRRAYEAPSDAARAMRVRKQLRDDALFKSNIDEVHGRLNSADSYLQELAAMSKVILDKVEQACNGSYSPSDREKIAIEVEALQKEVLAVSNATYAQKYLFEAAGGEYHREPFNAEVMEMPLLKYQAKIPVTDADGNIIWETIPNLNGDPPVEGIPQTRELTVQMGTHVAPPAGKYVVTAQDRNNGTVTLSPLMAGDPPKYMIEDWDDGNDKITLVELDVTKNPPEPTQTKIQHSRVALSGFTKSEGEISQQVGGQATVSKVDIYQSNGKIDPNGQTVTMPMAVLDGLEKIGGYVTEINNGAFKDRVTYVSDGNPVTIPVDSIGAQQNAITPTVVTEKALTYHGMVVDHLTYNKVTGTVQQYVMDEATGLLLKNEDGTLKKVDIPYNRTNYIDIGLGFEVMTIGSDKYLDSETALPFTLSGARVFGVGVDEETGLSHNMYNYLGNVVTAMRENDMSGLSEQLDHFYGVHDTLLAALADIGARYNFADDMKTILTNDEYVMTDKQVALESVDLQKEAIYNKSFDMAWMVTLQLGSRILPTSLFDFMR